MKNIKTTEPILTTILTLLLSLVLTSSIFASTPSIFDVMSYQEVLEVTMEGDFEALRGNRRSGDAEVVTLSFTDATGQLQTWYPKVTLRGHFRRMRCTAMPPLKLNFKKGVLKEAGLSKFDDMKLVTQCMEELDNSRELVLKEYLAYKIYNGITEDSYRVQLLKITYKDTVTKRTKKQWGFLIEDSAEMRKRIAVEKNEQQRGFKATDFQPTSFYKMAIFQYLIGNSDWDMSAGRNIKIVKRDGQLLVIPYDFDFSGLVDADYALLNSNYGLTSLQERVYLGYEEDLKNLDATLAFYKEQEQAIKEIVKNFKLLKGRHRKAVNNYLESFFDNMDTIEYRPKRRLMVSKTPQID